MGCHRNFWAIVKYIFEIHGSIFKPNKIWKSHLPFQQYMNKEPRFQISAKSDNVWRKYITFSGSRSWIYLEVAVHYTAAPRCGGLPVKVHSSQYQSWGTLPTYRWIDWSYDWKASHWFYDAFQFYCTFRSDSDLIKENWINEKDFVG